MLPAGEKSELMALLSRHAAKNNMPSVQIYSTLFVSTVFVTKPIHIFLLPFFKKDPISRLGLKTSFHLAFAGPSLGQHKF
jgi:hypothetical protein